MLRQILAPSGGTRGGGGGVIKVGRQFWGLGTLHRCLDPLPSPAPPCQNRPPDTTPLPAILVPFLGATERCLLVPTDHRRPARTPNHHPRTPLANAGDNAPTSQPPLGVSTARPLQLAPASPPTCTLTNPPRVPLRVGACPPRPATRSERY